MGCSFNFSLPPSLPPSLSPSFSPSPSPPPSLHPNQVMELMSGVLEVSISEIKETVKRDRCDWLAAIYNLLLDYPDGRMAVQKMLSDDRSQSVGSSQESLNGVSGFSQGLSQGVLTVWLGVSCCHGNILSCA